MVAPSRHYTFEDYLSVEEMSAVRHEFLDGEIFALAGGTPEHAALSAAAVIVDLPSLGIQFTVDELYNAAGVP